MFIIDWFKNFINIKINLNYLIMAKSIENLKIKLSTQSAFVSIKGGRNYLSLDSNGDGCINSGDCTGSVNDKNCENKQKCGPKPIETTTGLL